MPRFAILEHTGAPDDPAGRHFDLLLEAGDSCRTWRLATLPEPGGPAVVAVELPPHRLAWLDHVAGDVSAGRGFARRIDAGTYELGSADAGEFASVTRCVVAVAGEAHTGRLRVESVGGGWSVRLD